MLPLWIIALHMLGDFVTQTQFMANDKFKHADVRTLHVMIYTVPFFVLSLFYVATYWHALAFVICVFSAHWLTDCRRWASDKAWNLKPLMVDQTLHMLQLALFSTLFLKP